jgi:hypothetical protein
MTLRTGDEIMIEYEGRRVPGLIALASSNERSLMITFDAMIDGHVGMMPLLRDEHGVYRSLATKKPVKITPRSMH